MNRRRACTAHDADTKQELLREGIESSEQEASIKEQISREAKNDKVMKKQKWELLKYAYDNYPKDTVARFVNGNVDHTSTGKFQITDMNHDRNIQVISDTGMHCFYADGEWAVPVAPSILSGRVAVQVNNEREFKLLMEHYVATHRIEQREVNVLSTLSFPQYWTYNGNPYRPTLQKLTDEGYRVVPFSDFAAEVGITVPVFVMTSEDGVPLYFGMEMWGATYFAGLKEWRTQSFNDEPFILSENNTDLPDDEDFPYLSSPDIYKAFSTKEAAEKWCDEQNQPKSIIVHIDAKNSVEVTTDGTRIKLIDGRVLNMSHETLEEIYKAYQSLQEETKS